MPFPRKATAVTIMRVAFHPVDGPTYDILATPETAISLASCKIDRNIS